MAENKQRFPAQIHILDSQSDQILDVLTGNGDSAFWDDIHRISLQNNEETFDFKTLPDGHAAEHIKNRNRLIIPVEKDVYREFIIDETILTRDSLEVFATASYVDLNRAKPLAPAEYPGTTLNIITDDVLYATGWQVGVIEFGGTGTVIFERHISPYKALQAIASEFDIELRFRVETKGNRIVGRYVDFLKRNGTWRGREITSGKDLVNARRTEKTDEVVTALVGVGPETKDGNQIIVEVTDSDAFQNWNRNGKHLWGIFEPKIDKDAEEVTEEDVRTATEEELQRRISSVVEYEINAVDLEYVLGREHEKIRLGDDVRVKATEFNPPIYLSARVIEIDTPISDPSQKVYVLGEFIEYAEEDIENLRDEFAKRLKELDLEDSIHYGTTPPEDPDKKLWVDLSSPDNPTIKAITGTEEPIVVDEDISQRSEPLYVIHDSQSTPVFGFNQRYYEHYYSGSTSNWWRYEVTAPGDVAFETPTYESIASESSDPDMYVTYDPKDFADDFRYHGIRVFPLSNNVAISVIYEYVGDQDPYSWLWYGDNDDWNNGDNIVNNNGWRLTNWFTLTYENWEVFRTNYLQGQSSRGSIEWVDTTPDKITPQEEEFEAASVWTIPNDKERLPQVTVYKHHDKYTYDYQPFGTTPYGGNEGQLGTANPRINVKDNNDLEIQWDEPSYGKVVHQ